MENEIGSINGEKEKKEKVKKKKKWTENYSSEQYTGTG